jgi:hypothetical protein
MKKRKNYCNAADIELLERIARRTKMDCWFNVRVSPKDGSWRFKDLQNNKTISEKSAVTELLEGLQRETFFELEDHEKWLLLQAALHFATRHYLLNNR